MLIQCTLKWFKNMTGLPLMLAESVSRFSLRGCSGNVNEIRQYEAPS